MYPTSTLVVFRSVVVDKSSVVITYKSGHSLRVVVESFKVEYQGGDLISVTWENMIPSPMFLGIENIESIYQDVDSSTG